MDASTVLDSAIYAICFATLLLYVISTLLVPLGHRSRDRRSDAGATSRWCFAYPLAYLLALTVWCTLSLFYARFFLPALVVHTGELGARVRVLLARGAGADSPASSEAGGDGSIVHSLVFVGGEILGSRAMDDLFWMTVGWVASAFSVSVSLAQWQVDGCCCLWSMRQDRANFHDLEKAMMSSLSTVGSAEFPRPRHGLLTRWLMRLGVWAERCARVGREEDAFEGWGKWDEQAEREERYSDMSNEDDGDFHTLFFTVNIESRLIPPWPRYVEIPLPLVKRSDDGGDSPYTYTNSKCERVHIRPRPRWRRWSAVAARVACAVTFAFPRLLHGINPFSQQWYADKRTELAQEHAKALAGAEGGYDEKAAAAAAVGGNTPLGEKVFGGDGVYNRDDPSHWGYKCCRHEHYTSSAEFVGT